MTIYVILVDDHVYGYDYPVESGNVFVELAKSEDEAKKIIDDHIAKEIADSEYSKIINVDSCELYPNGAICVETSDADSYYHFKKIDI